MEYYHSLITQKSFDFLQKLRREFEFILIGGWAVFLYSHSLKSKDIDIIVDYSQLAKLKEIYNVAKNDRLKKYEIKTGEFDIDVYLNHYSELGVGISEIEKYTAGKQGFRVPGLEILFLLKLFAWLSRRGSVKGKKDELDIFSLAFLPEFDWLKYGKLVEDLKFEKYGQSFLQLLTKTRAIAELGINEQKMAKTRKNILSKFIFGSRTLE
ncbi:MAG: hypothetical protein UW11_C0011G0020 [Parcubacteria group bacterium GW2011_GWA2_43_9b]|nr:MAG: hypothetical protein UW11_C0011G0020 [Parcubacteria group bacterium GW2011_GWA2_43_9b]